MPTLRLYLPFLILPFLIGDVAPTLRLLALLLAGGFGLWQWLQDPRPYKLPEGTDSEAALRLIHPWVLAGTVGILYFFPENPIFRYRLWPIAMGGVFLWLSVQGAPIDRLAGFSLVLLLLWLIVILSSFSSALFPAEQMARHVNSMFSFPEETLGIAADPIVWPPLHSGDLPFHAVMLAMTAFVFTGAFWPIPGSQRFFKWIPLAAWCLFLLFYNTHGAIYLLCTLTILFVLLCKRSWLLEQSHASWIILFPLVLMGLERLDVVSYLLAFIPNPITGMEWESPILQTLYLTAPDDHPMFTLTRAFANSVNLFASIPLLVIFGTVLYRGIKYPEFAPLSAASLGILIMTLVYCHWIPLVTLTHPLTWFAILLSGQYLPTDLELNPAIDLKFMTWCPEKKAIGVGLLLLFILASLNVFHDGRADRRLMKLSEIPSVEGAQQIAESYPYRPDITAAYTTLTLQYYVSRKIVPEKEVLISIEKDLFTSLRYHYIPLLALKRYSDLFHMVSDDNRALQIMEYAAARFPSHLPTHLLVAQQYEAQGRLVEAQKFYKLCVNLDPASPELRKKLAQLYKKGGKENEFREQLRYLILLDPTAKLD